MENVESLYNLYQGLQEMDGITSTFESVIVDGSYLAAIKAHPTVKIKGPYVKTL